ncbi:T9SS type A sorting domain-containing protein [Carboxylicivirga marina]|uniref:T9SS type A sorting domain-containing protein n=1 Tax=Carboxylicivirga marina TaxID=2800988 RepID=UPI00259A16D7|nr:T9SS type A sorting domain-containing protein [uncultured Carboxylicivirga sp.]
MRTHILLFMILMMGWHISAQKTLYISSASGNDNNNGLSSETPLKSIKTALLQFNATEGGICYLMEGVYQEEIILNGKNDITIMPYQGANVVMDGTEIITASWNAVSGMPNVFRAVVDKDMWQLFVNNKEQIMARWPNTTFDNDEIYHHEKWAVCDNGSAYGTVDNIKSNGHGYDFPASLNKNISGGMVVYNFGSFKTWASAITSDISNNGFTYSTSDNGSTNGQLRSKHRYYFIEGKLHLLDAENEWFFQEENDTRYVYAWSKTGDGSDLNHEDAIIRGKVQSYAFDIRNASNVVIEGIKFFGTTVRLETCDYTSVRNCVFSYPNYSKRMLKSTEMPLVTSIDQDISTGKLANFGSSYNCTFEGNVFEYTDGEAFIAAGNKHVFHNNYMHHIDWSCANTQSLGLTVYVKGNDFEFSNNILHTTGASATLNLGNRSKVLFNDMSNTGYAQSDGSVVQHTTASVKGSETAYNWIHDTGKYGFRFDAPASTPCEAGEYGLAHHNVIWNIGDPNDNTGGIGMMIKGDHQQTYNNTVFNCLKTDILIINEGCSDGINSTNGNSFTQNNLTDFITGHRTNVYNNAGDIPGVVTNNVSQWKDDVPGASTTNVNYDISNFKLSKAVYHYFPGASNDANAVEYDANNVVINRANYDFRPKTGQTNIIDAGYEILSSKLFNQGEADSNITNSNLNPSVNAPDIGAYEVGGTVWVPGIDFEPDTYPWKWPFEEESSNIFTPEHSLDAKLFPVPVHNGQLLTVQSDQRIKSISIYNLNAQKVLVIYDRNTIPTQGLKPGSYIVHIQSDNNQITSQKLLIL